jgi:hypothetical protein
MTTLEAPPTLANLATLVRPTTDERSGWERLSAWLEYTLTKTP